MVVIIVFAEFTLLAVAGRPAVIVIMGLHGEDMDIVARMHVHIKECRPLVDEDPGDEGIVFCDDRGPMDGGYDYVLADVDVMMLHYRRVPGDHDNIAAAFLRREDHPGNDYS